jgi:hypothetical protein
MVAIIRTATIKGPSQPAELTQTESHFQIGGLRANAVKCPTKCQN